MKNSVLKISLLAFIAFSLSSCGYLLLSAVAPNSCKKCEILDGGSIISSEEACGGALFNMEQRMKAEAHDMGQGYYVECESYKAEE